LILTAMQKYGAIPVDTTAGGNLGFRFEAAVTHLFTSGNHFSPLTIGSVTSPSNTIDAMIKQVPTSAWRMIDASYRPPVLTGTWTVGMKS